MAKKKKNKWPYKFVSPGTFDELQNLSDKELLDRVLRYDTNVKAETKNKKASAIVKENAEVINKHRKQYVEHSQTFEEARANFDHEKILRDADVLECIEEKADVEKGFNDAIKNFKEHFSVAMKLLKERK